MHEPVRLLMLTHLIYLLSCAISLQNELQGYQEYANKVRYRLFPGVW